MIIKKLDGQNLNESALALAPIFDLGKIYVTRRARKLLKRTKTTVSSLLNRHARGQWDYDGVANSLALVDKTRILGKFFLVDKAVVDATPAEKLSSLPQIWILGDAEKHGTRCATTILTPEEY